MSSVNDNTLRKKYFYTEYINNHSVYFEHKISSIILKSVQEYIVYIFFRILHGLRKFTSVKSTKKY